MADVSGLTIAAVERDTGLSKDTLRVWERRYGFPKPLRDPSGERLYAADDVERLRLIKRLLDQGHRPGKLVGTAHTELLRLLETHAPRAAAGQPGSAECAALINLLKLHRSDELRAMLSQTLLKFGLQRFVAEIVAPLNRHVGEAWLRGEIAVMEEHLYTELIQNTLRAAINAHVTRGARPRVLLTTFPDEEHTLGLLMAEAMLVPEGAHCISLGTQTPLSDIRMAAASGSFDIVALSFSSAYPVRQAVDGLLSLRDRLAGEVGIWAGGAGICGRQRSLPGIRVIAEIDDTLAALRDWHNAHLNS